MLDKARNHLIACAFRKANITSLESDPTAAEIEDAAHTLNCMLQSWNNDGFRLFKIKTGYMPFIPNANEYSLKSQAYKSLEYSDIAHIDRIGATKIKLTSISGISTGQKVVAIDNVATTPNSVLSVDYETNTVSLSSPLEFGIYSNTAVFYGEFNTAVTELKTYGGAFNSLGFDNYSVAPVVGDTVAFCYNGSWTKRTITQVDATNKTFSFGGTALPAGSITNVFVVFGNIVLWSTPAQDYPIGARRVVLTDMKEAPSYLAVPSNKALRGAYAVESYDLAQKQVILEEAISEDILEELGENKIEADVQYPEYREVTWSELANSIPTNEIDWGSITDSSGLVTDDWGYITDAASVLEDWGTLTGDARIAGFSVSDGVKYVLVKDSSDDSLFVFYDDGTGWQQADLSGYGLTSYTLFTAVNKTFVCDEEQGLYLLNGAVLSSVYTAIGVEKIIWYKGAYYLVSPKGAGTIERSVVSTVDFSTFGAPYTVLLDSIANPAEFKERLFIGTTDTFVGDMVNFSDTDVYSQNRCVIGDRLINLNTAHPCSYTLDGVNFYPMPMMLSNQTAWASKDGCAFIAVYGVLNGGVVSTQIFTANDFNPVWTPQVVVPGRVFDIFFDETKAYFVSDVAVFSLLYNVSVESEEPVKAFLFGDVIGRPQQLMNVMKFGLLNNSQLPMNALALKDFLLLPHDQLDGEPVNYCFMREAEDGKMMIWGTPNKFGEYLRFSYVEPITLLEGARSTPDFPDEYYEAVEDGLAAQLAGQYGAPIDRQKELAAKAQESKENAILHDNEDTSYSIAPNERWG